jgi:hypothetical protein
VSAALGKGGGLVMHRAIFKMEHEVVGYGFADRGLGQITLGESLSLHCSEYKKTVNQAFGVAYANFFGMEERWAEQCARQHSDQEISVHHKSLPQSVDHGAVDQLPYAPGGGAVGRV